jgi:hypothetical protein
MKMSPSYDARGGFASYNYSPGPGPSVSILPRGDRLSDRCYNSPRDRDRDQIGTSNLYNSAPTFKVFDCLISLFAE